MSDGAHQGVSAKRALDTILGGKEPPTKEEEQTRAQVLERIMAAPAPLSEPRPSDYGQAADAIAKAFWLVHTLEPELELTVDKLWEATKGRFPGFGDWVGGPTGFQVGWAANCVRWLADQPPAPNPAILEIG